MHLPHSRGFSYIVQGHCLLTYYPEFRMLRKETVQTLGDWIFKDILCQWGMLIEIVSDNSKAFIIALSHLEKKYHIKHIWISSYNLHANGIVECLHFDIQQALFKVSDGADNKWSQVVQSVFWLECMTPCKCMGCSPYFAVTGTHLLLPFDIIEVNYLLPPPDSLLLTTNLVACCAVALQKQQTDLACLRDHIHKTQNCMALQFKCKNTAIICDFNFKSSDLVLLRNTAIEKALNCKMCP